VSIASIEVSHEEKLLFGGRAIQRFVQGFSDEPITLSQIYYWVAAGHLPVQRLGTKIIGNPTVIRAALHGEAEQPTAA
jgi:hypothetical protein